MEQFYAAWADVSTQAGLKAAGQPDNLSGALNTVYQTAATISNLLNSEANALNSMVNSINTSLTNTVQAANNQIQQIYNLNKAIVNAYGQGFQPNDLLDKRTAAMDKLAELINFTTATKTDGSVVIQLGGYSLVNGANGTSKLTTVAGVANSKNEDLGIYENGGNIAKPVNGTLVTGGEIAGIFQSRDSVIHPIQSNLDSVANTMITVINRIYSASTSDGVKSDNNDFFSGSLASDISVKSSITSGANISYSMYGTGDLAKILGTLDTKLVSTYVSTSNTGLKSGSLLFGGNAYNGSITINNVVIPVTKTTTVKDFINAINQNSNSFSASFNDQTGSFFIVSNTPLTISESYTAAPPTSLLNSLGFVEEQVSTSPITLTGQAINFGSKMLIPKATSKTINDVNVFDLQPSASGEIAINIGTTYNTFTWDNTQNTGTIYFEMYTVDGNAASKPNLSKTTFENLKFHYGTKVGDGGAANEIVPFTISDITGNLTKTMKIVGNMHFGEYYKSVVDGLSADVQSADDTLSASQAALDQLNTMQSNITKVNQDQELAQAKEYQRAYDASVQLMNVIDEMLNILINKTGSSSTAISN
jgi:flagellar hook-associated protein FlgK